LRLLRKVAPALFLCGDLLLVLLVEHGFLNIEGDGEAFQLGVAQRLDPDGAGLSFTELFIGKRPEYFAFMISRRACAEARRVSRPLPVRKVPVRSRLVTQPTPVVTPARGSARAAPSGAA
jgi:hypothetical protein